MVVLIYFYDDEKRKVYVEEANDEAREAGEERKQEEGLRGLWQSSLRQT